MKFKLTNAAYKTHPELSAAADMRQMPFHDFKAFNGRALYASPGTGILHPALCPIRIVPKPCHQLVSMQ